MPLTCLIAEDLLTQDEKDIIRQARASLHSARNALCQSIRRRTAISSLERIDTIDAINEIWIQYGIIDSDIDEL